MCQEEPPTQGRTTADSNIRRACAIIWRTECITLQTGHLLYDSEANNGKAIAGFLANKKSKANVIRVTSGNSRVAELVVCITDISTDEDDLELL